MMLRSLLLTVALGLLALAFSSSPAPASADLEADLAVSHQVTPPSQADVNTGFGVPVTISFSHLGPSEETVPAVFSYSLNGGPDCTPHSQGPSPSSISFGSVPSLIFTAPAFCTTAGLKTFVSRVEFLPGPGVNDPDLANNVHVIIFDVLVVSPVADSDDDGVLDDADNCPLTANPDQADIDDDGVPGVEPGVGDLFGGDACDPVINVTIDIKPGSDPNSIKVGDTGSVPVAIFSTAKFDATSIDAATLQFNSASVRLVGGKKLLASSEDINGDGLADLIVKFDRGLLDLEAGDGIGAVAGYTLDSESILGIDMVRVIE